MKAIRKSRRDGRGRQKITELEQKIARRHAQGARDKAGGELNKLKHDVTDVREATVVRNSSTGS